jgi:hypothetical protein
MKKLTLSIYFAAISLLFSGCSSDDKNPSFLSKIFNWNSSKEKPAETNDDSNKNNESNEEEESEPEEVVSSDYYRLSAISGFFMPRGETYEFDKTKKKWCQRPSSGELMAYITQNKIEDPNDVPDLSYYFDEKSNRQLNSCFLLIKSKAGKKSVTLIFGGNLICDETVDENSKIINVRGPFKYFNLAENAGMMNLSGGRNYNILLDNPPSIKFKNEYGEYELNFQKYDIDKAGKTMAMVVSDMAHFYSSPDISKKDRSYIVKDQAVFFDKTQNDFVHAYFTNNLGVVTEGWLLKSDLDVIY